jgi:hypothetical protein
LRTVKGIDKILSFLPKENCYELISISESAKFEGKTEKNFESLVERLNILEFEFTIDSTETIN